MAYDNGRGGIWTCDHFLLLLFQYLQSLADSWISWCKVLSVISLSLLVTVVNVCKNCSAISASLLYWHSCKAKIDELVFVWHYAVLYQHSYATLPSQIPTIVIKKVKLLFRPPYQKLYCQIKNLDIQLPVRFFHKATGLKRVSSAVLHSSKTDSYMFGVVH